MEQSNTQLSVEYFRKLIYQLRNQKYQDFYLIQVGRSYLETMIKHAIFLKSLTLQSLQEINTSINFEKILCKRFNVINIQQMYNTLGMIFQNDDIELIKIIKKQIQLFVEDVQKLLADQHNNDSLSTSQFIYQVSISKIELEQQHHIADYNAQRNISGVNQIYNLLDDLEFNSILKQQQDTNVTIQKETTILKQQKSQQQLMTNQFFILSHQEQVQRFLKDKNGSTVINIFKNSRKNAYFLQQQDPVQNNFQFTKTMTLKFYNFLNKSTEQISATGKGRKIKEAQSDASLQILQKMFIRFPCIYKQFKNKYFQKNS